VKIVGNMGEFIMAISSGGHIAQAAVQEFRTQS